MTSITRTRERDAIRVSVSNIALNFILALFKLLAGIFAHSAAMISDAVHTLSDALSTLLVIAGIRLAAKKPDSGHQYGHERFESVAAILLSAVLAVTGALIGIAGVRNILDHSPYDFVTPGVWALVAAVLSIVFKEAMYWRTRHWAKRLNSSALMADAWHNRSDSLSSIGSFAGILGARLGFPILDPLVGVVICVFILKAAIDVFRDAVGKMTDRAVDADTAAQIQALAEAQPGVEKLDLLQTRVFGDRVYVDIEIAIDRSLPLHDAHDIAQHVHNAVETRFPMIKHCMVHMNPTSPLSESNSHAADEIRKADNAMLFVVLGYDGTDSEALPRRMASRPAHLEFVKSLKEAGIFQYGGALLDEEGEMIGSMMILDYPSREALEAEFLPNEPYAIDGVWETIQIHGFRPPTVT